MMSQPQPSSACAARATSPASTATPRLKFDAQHAGTRSAASRRASRWASERPVVPDTKAAPRATASASTRSKASGRLKSTSASNAGTPESSRAENCGTPSTTRCEGCCETAPATAKRAGCSAHRRSRAWPMRPVEPWISTRSGAAFMRGRLARARRRNRGSGHHPVPEALDAVEEGTGLRRMPERALADEGGLEQLQQFALLGGQVDRRLHHRLAVQVARRTAAYRPDALVAQPELFAGLGLGRDPQFDLAVERRHPDDVAERRLRDPDRDLAVQVVAVALEDRMRAHPHLDVQVAGRGAGGPGLALARQPDAVAAGHARRDLHRPHLLLPLAAVAVAGLARVGDGLAAAAAVRARLLHGEDAALHAHLAAPVAGAAGLQPAVLGAAAVAAAAGRQRGQLDTLLDPGHGLLEVELHDVADVGAAARAACAAAAAEDVAEDVPEDVAHVAEAGTRAGTAAAHAVLERGMPVGVVQPAPRRVGQHLVGFLALLERLQRRGVPRVAVRVVLHRAAPVGLLQFVVAGVAGNAEYFVVIPLRHRVPSTANRGPCPRSPGALTASGRRP